MFSILAKLRLVPLFFCVQLIKVVFLYIISVGSVGFFVYLHTPGYSNPSKAQLHLRVFAPGGFQQSPMLYPFRQLHHVRCVDAEEVI